MSLICSKPKAWQVLTILIFLLSQAGMAQEKIKNIEHIDFELLNSYIAEEINLHRQDLKLEPLIVETLLSEPAQDHVKYMTDKNKLTHKQKEKEKKTPKNRVDFYGEHFEYVYELIQFNSLELEVKLRKDKHLSKVDTYDRLAKLLVESWHKNRDNKNFFLDPRLKSCYTKIIIKNDRSVYACLLLAPRPYFYPSEFTEKPYDFKPEKLKKCRRCRIKKRSGFVLMDQERRLYFYSHKKRISDRIIQFRRWNDGIAADIILKDQYPCDQQDVFNGKTNVRGIPLQPVFKKSFRKGNNSYSFRKIFIYLGQVPEWVDQDFEVNLTEINNKRTCSMSIFHVIPTDFKLDIDIPIKLDTNIREIIQYENDTIYKRIPYAIASDKMDDSLLFPVMNYIKEHRHELVSVSINGYSSIDGYSDKNIRLQEKRMKNIREHLIDIGVDSTGISAQSLENEALFRTEIAGGEFAYLNKLSNQEIKDSLMNPSLLAKLEPLLQKHRYADLQVVLKREIHLPYDAELTKKLMQEAVDQKKTQEARAIQAIQYYLLKKGELTVVDLDETEIPFENRYKHLIYNRAVMKFKLDSLNPEARTEFSNTLAVLNNLDSVNVKINTSLEILEYEDILSQGPAALKRYYKILRKKKYINEKYRAKMLLMVAYTHDMGRFKNKRIIVFNRYLYQRAKSHVETADLSVQERFDLAKYYTFFDQNRYAYYLTSTIVKRTHDTENLVFFLKLIHLTDIHLPRTTYLKFFERIKRLSGDQYCSFFNSPFLNFQILDDPEIKEIYCEQCKDYVPKK